MSLLSCPHSDLLTPRPREAYPGDQRVRASLLPVYSGLNADPSVDTQAKLYALEHLRALTAVVLGPLPTVGSPDNQLCALLGLGHLWDGPGWNSAGETSEGGPCKQRAGPGGPCEAETHSALERQCPVSDRRGPRRPAPAPCLPLSRSRET